MGWSDYGCVIFWRDSQQDSSDILDVGCKRSQELRLNEGLPKSNVFGLKKWEDRVGINWDKKNASRAGFARKIWSSVFYIFEMSIRHSTQLLYVCLMLKKEIWAGASAILSNNSSIPGLQNHTQVPEVFPMSLCMSIFNVLTQSLSPLGQKKLSSRLMSSIIYFMKLTWSSCTTCFFF